MALLLAGGMASAQVNIEGNVFGGGYDGTVSDSTTVTVNGGTVGRKLTLDERKADPDGQAARIRFGNVYGGGDGSKLGVGGDPTSWLTWDISVYVCPPGGITGYISSHTQRVLVGMINY